MNLTPNEEKELIILRTDHAIMAGLDEKKEKRMLDLIAKRYTIQPPPPPVNVIKPSDKFIPVSGYKELFKRYGTKEKVRKALQNNHAVFLWGVGKYAVSVVFKL